MKTRTYLFLMAGAILLPVAIASWIGLSMLLDWERESRLRSVREMARATAFQIDRERISLGSGKRVLAKDGRLDPKYQITVPEDLSAPV